MAFLHGKNSTVLIDQTDFSTYLNNATVAATADSGETTCFQVPGGSRTYLQGLNGATVSMSGLFDGVPVTGQDALMAAYIALADNVPYTIIPGVTAALAQGVRCMIGEGMVTSYQVTAPLADVVSTSLAMQVDGGNQAGYVLQAGTAVTASSALGSPAGIDNAALTSLGAVGVLQVITNTRDAGSILVKIQHSVDNSTYTDLMSFTSVGFGAKSAQLLTSTGTVNRYLRAQWVVTAGTTGSYIFVVSAARRTSA